MTATTVSAASATCRALNRTRDKACVALERSRQRITKSHTATSDRTVQEIVDNPRPSKSHSNMLSGDSDNRPRTIARMRKTNSSPQYKKAGPTPKPRAKSDQRFEDRDTLVSGVACRRVEVDRVGFCGETVARVRAPFDLDVVLAWEHCKCELAAIRSNRHRTAVRGQPP